MRAMQLVSGSKFKRAQNQLVQVRAVMEFLDGLLQRVLSADPEAIQHPLATDKPGPTALVLVTSDTGLCGSYNTNLIQLAESHIRRETAHPMQYLFMGKKGHRYFTKRGYQPSLAYLDLAGRPNVARIAEIGRELMSKFLSDEVSSVEIISARFKSAGVARPAITRWLPVKVEKKAAEPAGKAVDEYIFEPSPEAVFRDLLPRWALLTFQLAILEAFTSEHSARMIAMKSATDNAGELIQMLTSQRNRIRQAAITKEISEIAGTAEALK